MRNLFIICLFYLLFGAFASAQVVLPTPRQDDSIRRTRENERKMEELRKMASAQPQMNRTRKGGANYGLKDSVKEQLLLLAPEKEYFSQYANFLRQEDTGITRLVAEANCIKDQRILDISCKYFAIPGNGASYSFRVNNYRGTEFSDISILDGAFILSGSLTQGIISSIGNIDLNQVSLDNEAIRYLNEFAPAKKITEARKQFEEFRKGVKSGKHIFSKAMTIEENNTYVLRSIAYRRESLGFGRMTIYDFDKRKDIIVAFRVLKKDESGAIILWKELQRKDSPTLKFDKRPDKPKPVKNNYEVKN